MRLQGGLLTGAAMVGLALFAGACVRFGQPEARDGPSGVDAGTRGPAVTAQGVSGLPTVSLADLPVEARETIAAIDRGGPFPYDRDGGTFQNREGLLPARRSGHYREYTVITPGSPDRGARRIVAGAGGELYYTDDHYDSFREVVR